MTFRTKSLPIIEKYRKAGTLVDVNAEPNIDASWNLMQFFSSDSSTAAEKPSRKIKGINLKN